MVSKTDDMNLWLTEKQTLNTVHNMKITTFSTGYAKHLHPLTLTQAKLLWFAMGKSLDNPASSNWVHLLPNSTLENHP